MSLIETAIKKIQASAAAQAQTAVATDTAPKRKSAVKFEPIDPTTIRQFKRVAHAAAGVRYSGCLFLAD